MLYENLTVGMQPAAIALNYSVENIRNDIRQKKYTYEKSQFDSLVWGSLTLAPIILLQNLLHSSTHWRTQDEQVTWAQHGHIQCTRNTHLLGELGHAPAVTLRSLLR